MRLTSQNTKPDESQILPSLVLPGVLLPRLAFPCRRNIEAPSTLRSGWYVCSNEPSFPSCTWPSAEQPTFISTGDHAKLLVHKISQDPGLPCEKPTNSFWQQDPPHPDLTAIQSASLPRQTDVLIIGSGITAASVSHHLLATDNNTSIVVAEARTITSGGTGRNGGHIIELPYEDYDFQVSMLGRSATKEIVQFRLDHLAEMVDVSKTQMNEKAAKESELRILEAADAVFDKAQWNKVKRQVSSFLEDFPEQKGKWKVLEKDEARKVYTCTLMGNIPGDVLTVTAHRNL